MDYQGDFLIYSGVLKEYRGPGGTVIIPEGVKRIDKEAFRNCGDITGVVLPRGIESIAFKAFYSCPTLKEITIYNDYPDNIGALFIQYETKYKYVRRENFHVTVMDSKNDAVYYQVLIVNDSPAINNFFFFEAWGKNSSFNFKGLDELLDSYKNVTNRLLTTYLRIKYPIELDEETGKKYRAFIKRNGYKAFPELIRDSKIEIIKAFLDMEAVNKTRIDSMIEIAREAGKADITALLMNYKQKIFGESKPSLRFSEKVIEEWKVKKEEPGFVWRYTGTDSEVVLPSEINGEKCIGVADTVFKKPENYMKIEKIVVPEGYKTIGKNAFSGCQELKEVVLPQSLELLGERCFANCPSLEKINLPDSLKVIPNEAFHVCGKLRQINFPKELESIGDEAFRQCDSLKEIDLGERVEELGERSFFGTQLETVIFRGEKCSAQRGICFTSPRYVFTDGKIYASEIHPKSIMPLSYLGLKNEELVKAADKEYLSGLTVYGYGKMKAFPQINSYLYPYPNISFSELITALGGTYSNTFKTTVDLVVFDVIDPENPTVQKALKRGTAIITELDFLRAVQKKEKLDLSTLRRA